MTIEIDTDGDGTPDAVIPIKWLLALLPILGALLGLQ